MAPPQTFWNGEPAEARRVVLVVADAPDFPAFWARAEGIIGQERYAVEVLSGNAPEGSFPFYLDDDNGSGWHKVTGGHGSPRWGHRDLRPERIVRVLDDDEPCRCGE
jgi:hypothetical protein